MSQMQVTVAEILVKDSLCLVKCRFETHDLTLITLELGTEVKVGATLKLSVKPFHIAIAKNFDGMLSYANRIETTILHIVHGELLCSLTLRTDGGAMIESVITEASARRLGLCEGERVTALIKATELSVSEVVL